MELLKTILELVSFATAPVLAIVAIIALRQIKEARNQVLEARNSRILNSKRDAFKIAAEKCSYYMETIIPLMNTLDKAIENNKVTYFDKSIVTITSNNFKLTPAPLTPEERVTLYSLPLTEVFNPLERLALFFTSGGADEQIGYLTIGHTFCQSIKRYLPVLRVFSKDREHYNNIMKLFV